MLARGGRNRLCYVLLLSDALHTITVTVLARHWRKQQFVTIPRAPYSAIRWWSFPAFVSVLAADLPWRSGIPGSWFTFDQHRQSHYHTIQRPYYSRLLAPTRLHHQPIAIMLRVADQYPYHVTIGRAVLLV
ncbi:hypothetical protein DFJ58DRAFT_383276 [Suillus subalutaceus]|uniref:uncharacterized protein n=1 Tax=Suillus subalutaceus TaxID=48586 RepID=UPI001B867BD6|nr:uncharacterized protein DFJ58DRAFT_383276 [Suillus subalutaceus]KAG1854154.1 hypothetical protein DFJ58DRAFT_383276 [Suillus subalutaceus]